uniref:Uncharacterized protein n=1 Tax=Arundo donax TaxID=35708 RepID=A0A0A8Y295_ARUDO
MPKRCDRARVMLYKAINLVPTSWEVPFEIAKVTYDQHMNQVQF